MELERKEVGEIDAIMTTIERNGKVNAKTSFHFFRNRRKMDTVLKDVEAANEKLKDEFLKKHKVSIEDVSANNKKGEKLRELYETHFQNHEEHKKYLKEKVTVNFEPFDFEDL